jgi:SAM-dependent methyltransferase
MSFLSQIYNNAVVQNNINILNMLEINTDANFLDLGCDDGKWTSELAKQIKTENINGIEVVDERILLAEKKGILIKRNDLNTHHYSYESEFFDVCHANQIIEHLYDTDNFLSEINRILKVGGYAIISTENAYSWHNIFTSLMGWQMFSLTNISMKKSGIGNPLAQHRNEVPEIHLKSWNHVTISNYLGLKELFEAFDFKIEEIKGAGYYPLPAKFGLIDPRHAHFLSFKLRKMR